MGQDYQSVILKRENGRLNIAVVRCVASDRGVRPNSSSLKHIPVNGLFAGNCGKRRCLPFLVQRRRKEIFPVGESFKAKEGRWIGAKVGLYALREGASTMPEALI
jgi:hypothetical protein